MSVLKMSILFKIICIKYCNCIIKFNRFNFNQHKFLKTSCTLWEVNRNSKKKLVKPVVFKSKSQKQQETVEIKNYMTVNDLAKLLDRSNEQIYEAMSYINSAEAYQRDAAVIDNLAIIKQIVAKCGYQFKVVSSEEKQTKVKNEEVLNNRRLPNQEKMVARPPVVTIMGHVDHGKTTLLDALRKTNVVAQEFGGITQHIGAFSVKLPMSENTSVNNTITFLDTPGHAAFSSMRARGAMVTDIVVLVVAADDGVMKQTVESLKFAKEAQVPIIVAINKIDKPNVDIESTKKSLLNNGIQLEEYGGDVQAVLVSALKGLNLNQLQECILAQAEVMDLKADPTCHVQAVCIESRTDPGRGKLSTMLIQHGTLKRGDILVGGHAWAKVRGMFNDQGKPIDRAEPGQPVEVIGWRSLAPAGQNIMQVDTEQEAKKLVWRHNAEESDKKIDMDDEIIQKKMDLHKQFYNELRKKKLELGWRVGSVYKSGKSKESQTDGDVPKLNIIIKGDVDGSVEAILDLIDTYSCTDQCRLNVINYGVGMVTENDVEMAQTFDGLIYTFNVETPDKILSLAKEKKVKLLNYNIIYQLVADLVKQLNNKLPEIEVEEIIGEANVLANFEVTEGKKKVWVAGCRCVKGQLNKKKHFKLVRNGETILQGPLWSLKHFKNEVDTIKTDVECGLSFNDQNECPRPGDQVICFEKVGKKQTIKWNLDFI